MDEQLGGVENLRFRAARNIQADIPVRLSLLFFAEFGKLVIDDKSRSARASLGLLLVLFSADA